MNRRLAVAVGCIAALLLALAALFVFRARSAHGPRTAPKPALETEPSPALEARPPAPMASASSNEIEPRTAPSAPAPAASALPTSENALAEASLMARLRELRGSNPELTLALAREAQRRFRSGPDAAEQAWFVVKSLTDLGRHDEARREGRKLLKDYPSTRWAEDVHRHLFVNPATDPAERGYGKDLDLP